MTQRYLSGGMDTDRVDASESFKARNKHLEHDKILRTTLMRAEEQAADVNIEILPEGEVAQVFSLFSEVEHDGKTWLCVARKTLSKISDTQMVVGDRVRFRDTSSRQEDGTLEGPLQGVIEYIAPRRTVLTRADSFKAVTSHPIVANADQMLIVVSLREPAVRWGLVDRMIVAAQGGGLTPIVCLNKIDLSPELSDATPLPPDASKSMTRTSDDAAFANAVLAHYTVMGIAVLRTSVCAAIGLDVLRELLKDKVTVLAGHSGVGKSSLIRVIQPDLNLRVAAISRFNDKGRHTTTSARRYPLDIGGTVVDTPGVKLFGLWGITRATLAGHFPDVDAGAAPDWRCESYERILESLPDDMPGETEPGAGKRR